MWVRQKGAVQKGAVQKYRNFPVYAEMQLQLPAAAARIKRSLCESALIKFVAPYFSHRAMAKLFGG